MGLRPLLLGIHRQEDSIDQIETMKRDPKLILHILKEVESSTDPGADVKIPHIGDFSKHCMQYHVELLLKKGYLFQHSHIGLADREVVIAGQLTWDGHNLLAEIKKKEEQGVAPDEWF